MYSKLAKYPIKYRNLLIQKVQSIELGVKVAEIIRVQITFLKAETPLRKIMVKQFYQIIFRIYLIFENKST